MRRATLQAFTPAAAEYVTSNGQKNVHMSLSVSQTTFRIGKAVWARYHV